MKFQPRSLLCVFALLSVNLHAQGDAATYTVKPGDSFAKIARNTGCSPAELAKANGLKLDSIIQPGQKLKLPAKAAKPSSSPSVVAAPAAAAPADGTHTIQPGETLSAVSRRYGVSLDSILAANPGINPKSLQPGQKIRLSTASKSQSQPAAVASASPVAPPATAPQPAAPPAVVAQDVPQEAPAEKPSGQPRTVMVDAEMTYGEFAAKYGTDIGRLNELNGLDLVPSTVLAKGSELYVPGQP